MDTKNAPFLSLEVDDSSFFRFFHCFPRPFHSQQCIFPGVVRPNCSQFGPV